MFRLLIDIGHPAHFYLFKNLAQEFIRTGNSVVFTIREGEKETAHAEYFGFKYYCIGKKRASTLGKIVGILIFSYKIFWISRKFKPTHFLSHGSIYAGIASFLLRKPHIALEDTGNMEQLRLSKPFSDVILSPDVLPLDLGRKHLRYNGYHELCYLSPNYFTPDSDIFNIIGIPSGTPYAILRFVAWNASHDIGQHGISDVEKIQLVEMLSSKMKVFISAEKNLIPELEPYRIKIHVTKMHDALAFASIYVGEGATMASEAGVLGTPSVYISSIRISYNEDQEKYGIVKNFTNYKDAIYTIERIVSGSMTKSECIKNRDVMLRDKIDVTAFLIWFVKNYPGSFSILKENPDYQFRFK